MHIDQYVQDMADNNEQLIFTYQPEVVKHAKDEPAEEPTVETHNAIAVYLEHNDTDFPTLLQAYKNSETGLSETDQAKYDKLVHSLKASRKAIKVIRGEVVRRAKVLFCTRQLAGSDLVSHNFAENVDASGVVIIADEDGQPLDLPAGSQSFYLVAPQMSRLYCASVIAYNFPLFPSAPLRLTTNSVLKSTARYWIVI
jgi:hypothetical protein